MRRIHRLAILSTIACAIPGGATAQQMWDEMRSEASGALNVAIPVGEFGEHVELGGGVGTAVVLFLDPKRRVGVRTEAGYIVYGSDTEKRRFSRTIPLVELDVRTTNQILSAGIGPQIYLGTGNLRPFVYGTVGFAYFATTTTVEPEGSDIEIASTTNFDDFQLSLNAGGGIAAVIHGGDNPLSLSLSASYQRNGLTEYLTGGNDDLYRGPGGRWEFRPKESEANLITCRLGLSVALGRR